MTGRFSLLKRVQIIGVLLAMVWLAAGCSIRDDVEISTQETTAKTKTESVGKKIFVHVCGQVKHPGVYQLSSDDRIVAAIKAAGGFTKKAAGESINQAEKVSDGQQIYIPSRKETGKQESSKKAGGQGSLSDGKININTAGKEELMTLSGIGESKAADIIAYRQEHGPFSKTEDIMKIQGIKEGIYNKIKDSITI